jgi:hypothetical protein
MTLRSKAEAVVALHLDLSETFPLRAASWAQDRQAVALLAELLA